MILRKYGFITGLVLSLIASSPLLAMERDCNEMPELVPWDDIQNSENTASSDINNKKEIISVFQEKLAERASALFQPKQSDTKFIDTVIEIIKFCKSNATLNVAKKSSDSCLLSTEVQTTGPIECNGVPIDPTTRFIFNKWIAHAFEEVLYSHEGLKGHLYTTVDLLHQEIVAKKISFENVQRLLNKLPDAVLLYLRDIYWKKYGQDYSCPCSKRVLGAGVGVLKYLGNRTVAVGCDDIKIWNIDSEQPVKTFGHIVVPLSIAWLGDDKLAVGYDNQTLRILNINSGEYVDLEKGDAPSGCHSLAALNQNCLVSGLSYDLKIWNVRDRKAACFETEKIIREILVLDEDRIVVLCYDGYQNVCIVKILNTIEKEWLQKSFKVNVDDIFAKRFAVYDKNHIVIGTVNSTVEIWDIDRGECVQSLREDRACSLYSIDVIGRNHIMSLANTGRISLWNRSAGMHVGTIAADQEDWDNISNRIWDAMVIDEHTIVSGSCDPTPHLMQIWTIPTLEDLLQHTYEQNKEEEGD